MINFGINSGSLLGILDLFLALAYFTLSPALPIAMRRDLGVTGTLLYIGQVSVAPSFLFIIGFILFFQGWRLDPILQFSYVLMHFLVIYLGFKDIVISRLIYPRIRR